MAARPAGVVSMDSFAMPMTGRARLPLRISVYEKIAAAITRCMQSEEAWWKRSRAAHTYMQAFDWNFLFCEAFQLENAS